MDTLLKASAPSELWLVLRAVHDFIRRFRTLHFVGSCVTVFGSARFRQDHPYYAMAREVGRRMSRMGFTVMTGGGPGLMEAANRGAKDVGGRSVGCNIELPTEQVPNPYLDRWGVGTSSFGRCCCSSTRTRLSRSRAELAPWTNCSSADADPNGQDRTLPVVLIGLSYWQPLLTLLNRMMMAGTIDSVDLQLILVTDDPSRGRGLASRLRCQRRF